MASVIAWALAANAEGDVAAGAEVFVSRSLGHCVLCHRSDAVDAPFQGNLGPDLSRIGERLDADEIRARIVDPQRFNPNSIMPAYRRTSGLNAVDPAFLGKPILSAVNVDDLVAFLSGKKGASGAVR